MREISTEMPRTERRGELGPREHHGSAGAPTWYESSGEANRPGVETSLGAGAPAARIAQWRGRAGHGARD